jgi:hypothetical protein
MATAVARPRRKLRADDVFFSGMAVLALITVWLGFARTYFLAGLLRAPLPNLLIHIHAAVFTLWIVFFVTQISLVVGRQLAVHRRNGLYGFALAAAMIVLGFLAASDRVARHNGETPTDTPEQYRAFFAVGLSALLLFGTFVAVGYRNRKNPVVHKRVMLFATFALLEAAFDRWSVFDPFPIWQVTLICYVPLALLTMAYDRWSTGRVQLVTVWSSIFLLAVFLGRDTIGHTGVFQHFAAWIEHLNI